MLEHYLYLEDLDKLADWCRKGTLAAWHAQALDVRRAYVSVSLEELSAYASWCRADEARQFRAHAQPVASAAAWDQLDHQEKIDWVAGDSDSDGDE